MEKTLIKGTIAHLVNPVGRTVIRPVLRGGEIATVQAEIDRATWFNCAVELDAVTYQLTEAGSPDADLVSDVSMLLWDLATTEACNA
jgi:hypothetical protein